MLRNPAAFLVSTLCQQAEVKIRRKPSGLWIHIHINDVNNSISQPYFLLLKDKAPRIGVVTGEWLRATPQTLLSFFQRSGSNNWKCQVELKLVKLRGLFLRCFIATRMAQWLVKSSWVKEGEGVAFTSSQLKHENVNYNPEATVDYFLTAIRALVVLRRRFSKRVQKFVIWNDTRKMKWNEGNLVS